MEALLSIINIYTILKHNPINNWGDLRSLLKIWKRLEFVTDYTYNFLNSTSAMLSRAYGLPKIHKTGNLLHISIIHRKSLA